MAEMIVVEVDVRISLEALQVLRERPQCALAVAAPVLAGGAMKAKVAETPGEAGRTCLHQVVLAKSGAVRVEQVADRRGVPGRAAELDRVAQAAPRQLVEETGQPIGIGPVHLRRKLPEHDRELAAQAQDQVEIPIDPWTRILEALHVREVAASLGGEAEAARGAFAPTVHRRRGRQAIEGRVQLDGG